MNISKELASAVRATVRARKKEAIASRIHRHDTEEARIREMMEKNEQANRDVARANTLFSKSLVMQEEAQQLVRNYGLAGGEDCRAYYVGSEEKFKTAGGKIPPKIQGFSPDFVYLARLASCRSGREAQKILAELGINWNLATDKRHD